jgi:hypothetical protein
MAVDRKEAGALLSDVAGTERRVREFLVYSNASAHLILWGILWAVAYSGSHLLATSYPRLIGPMWLIAVAIGALATVLLVRRAHVDAPPRPERGMDLRPAVAPFAFLVFGGVWIALGHLGWREQAAFYPTLFGTLIFVMGLWAGRWLAAFGAALFILTLIGYFVSGPWFEIWMAVGGGGLLVGTGLWLRR